MAAEAAADTIITEVEAAVVVAGEAVAAGTRFYAALDSVFAIDSLLRC